MKAILLILALVLVYWYFWGRRAPGEPRDETATRNNASPERMVHCAYCGLHVPESESIVAAGRHYCSDEHRRIGAP